MPAERLDKILSHEGFGSRKSVRRLLRDSLVVINGKPATDPSLLVNAETDSIEVCGEPLVVRKNIYLMMNKPQDTVSANKDGLHQTVFDLLDEKYRTSYLEENLHLAGRLDVDTEGLLLFTTDGKLIHRITSPKTHSPKSYFVRLEKEVSPSEMEKIANDFQAGLEIPPEGKEAGAVLKPAKVEWKNGFECVLTISEGKFHQVKRMFLAENNKVVYLKRLTIGSLTLDSSLECGSYRELTSEEVEKLVSCIETQ